MDWPTESDDPTDAFLAFVTDDVATALAPLFEPEDPEEPATSLRIPPEVARALPRSEEFAAVPWVWVGRHVGPSNETRGGLNDVRRTGEVVAVEGLSLLQRSGDNGVHIHRFVDWLGVYRQLGVVIAGRPEPPLATG